MILSSASGREYWESEAASKHSLDRGARRVLEQIGPLERRSVVLVRQTLARSTPALATRPR